MKDHLPPPPPSEEAWPPRVWIHTLDRKSVVPVHALIHFSPEHEHYEYLSLQEATAREKAAVEMARAEERMKAVVHVNAVQNVIAGRLLAARLRPSEAAWQFLTDAWNLNARFLSGENFDTQTEYLKNAVAPEPVTELGEA